MTIQSTTRKTAPLPGNGATTSFPFTFKVQDTDDIVVYAVTSSGESTVSEAAYTVNLNADQNTNPGGSVVMSAAPATGTSLVITTDADATQEQNIQNQGAFNPAIVMEALDKLTIQVQQLKLQTARSLRASVTASGFDPLVMADYANQYLAFDADGNPMPSAGAMPGSIAVSNFAESLLGAASKTALSEIAGYQILIEPDDDAYGGVADGDVDDTDNATALTAAVTAAALFPGAGVYIAPGKKYAFGSRVSLLDYTGFWGGGELIMLTDAGKFDNTDGTISGRYGTDAVGIYATGKTKPFVRGVKIRTSTPVNGQCIRPIYFTGCTEPEILSNDITDFTEAELISFSDCTRPRVWFNWIHDCHYDYAAIRRQLTGIGIDNDGTASTDISVMFNVIENLTASAAVITAWGYETDGVNITDQETTGNCAFNTIRNCGEGIDSFSKVQIKNNLIEDMYVFGIKGVHVPTDVDIIGNTIIRPGLAGIVLNNTSVYTGHASNITIRNNTIKDVDPDLNWNTDSAGILLVAGSSTYGLRHILVTGNNIDCGANGEYGIKATGTNTGGSCVIANDNHIVNAQTAPIFSPNYTYQLGAPFPRVFRGCTLANNGTDATNDIDISYGMVTDSTGVRVIRLNDNMTKQLDAAWAAGTNAGMRDTGSIANDTWHIWLIENPTTMAVDVLASLSASAPTMPMGYTYKAYLGAVIRVSSAIVAFSQRDDEFLLKVPVNNVNSSNPGTSAVLTTLRVPTGIKVDAIVNVLLLDLSPAATTQLLATSPDQDDTAASTYGLSTLVSAAVGASLDYQANAQLRIRTNTSAQMRWRVSASDADINVNVNTVGWIDKRNREAA